MSNEPQETAGAEAAPNGDSQTSLEDTNFLKAGQAADSSPNPEPRLSETGPQTEDTPPQPAEPAQNGHDQAAQANSVDNLPWPEEVPRDQQGKRPSQNTIDFDALKQHLPEEVFAAVENRFRSLYKQTKAQDRYLDSIIRDFGSVENFVHVHQEAAAEAQALKAAEAQREQAEAEATWKSEYARAVEDMDSEKQADLMLRRPDPTAAPEPAAPTSNIPAQETGGLPPEQRARANAWITERGPDGNYKRPWAADPSHPLHNYAQQEAFALMQHPKARGASIEQVLATVEQNINAQLGKGKVRQRTRQAPQPPLSANRDHRTTPNPDRVQLSAEQRVVAERFFSRDEPKVAHAKYLAGLKKSGMA